MLTHITHYQLVSKKCQIGVKNCRQGYFKLSDAAIFPPNFLLILNLNSFGVQVILVIIIWCASYHSLTQDIILLQSQNLL